MPLDDGIDDDSYESLFKPIMTRVMEQYQPSCIVLQSGELRGVASSSKGL